MEVPKMNSKDSPNQKLSWLRSQIIGSTAEFNSPFGKRRITYADSTATSRSLHFVEDYILHNVLPFYGNTHTSDSYVGQQSTKVVEDGARYIKRCMGGGEQDAILFCGSGSTAAIKRLQEVMGIAIPSTLRNRVSEILKDGERWVVFVGPYEHHSNLLSWRQSLAELVQIRLTHDGSVDLDDLKARLKYYATSNRPMLGSFSACSNVTGIVTDTRAIATLLHQYGAFACFDFAASGPYVEIKMRSGEIDGYDAVFVSPHKFIGGPGSPGILLMSKKLYQLSASAPSTCGGGTVNYVNGFSEEDTLYLENIEQRENAGTPAIIQIARAALAFWVKEHIGYETIANQDRNYMVKAFEKLGNIKNVQILGNMDVKRLSILSFLIHPPTTNTTECINDDDNEEDAQGKDGDKPLNGRFVAKLLNDLFGIQVRGGCACAGPYGHHLLHVDKDSSLAFRSSIQKGYEGSKPGWTRMSFPYYMSNDDFEFILRAVEFVAVHGHRFLPYYDFNWRNGDWRFDQNKFKEALQRLREDNNNNNSNNNTLSNSLDLLELASCMKQLKLSYNNRSVNLNPYFENPVTIEYVQCEGDNKEEKDTTRVNIIDMNIDDKDKCGTKKNKHTSYWEVAVYVACLLSKFPEQPRKEIPEDLFLDLPFKI